MKTPLFDVIISVQGDDETGGGIYTVQIIDRYHKHTKVVDEKREMTSLNDALAFAKGAVTAFMEGTQA